MVGAGQRMIATAVADEVELRAILDGLVAFVDREVVPLEKANQELFENGRLTYSETGGYSPAVRALFRQVHEASARAGYYAMFAPQSVGGSGFGSVTLFHVWEALNHVYGPGRLLPYEVVGHWTSGPSFLLGELHPSLRQGITEEVMSGAATV